MEVIQLVCGYDPRERIGFHVFEHTLIKHATRPVSITPLSQLGVDSGSNAFTLSRFLTPYLMGYLGHAIFLDGSDMMMCGDIAELDDLYDDSYAVQVVKHPNYESLHERKYIGTELECAQSNYDRKNWASCMMVNASHPAWKQITPDTLGHYSKLDMLQLRFIESKDIGELPPEWNVLIDEGQDDKNAKVLHWTAGIPGFMHYGNARRSKDWFHERAEMMDMRI